MSKKIKFKALIDNKVSHESHKYFTVTMNEEKRFHKLKESFRMMKSQRCHIEREKWIQDNEKWILIQLSKKMKELIKTDKRFQN